MIEKEKKINQLFYFRSIIKAVKQCRKKSFKRSSSNISVISFDKRMA